VFYKLSEYGAKFSINYYVTYSCTAVDLW
jgi:hypothetical protein